MSKSLVMSAAEKQSVSEAEEFLGVSCRPVKIFYSSVFVEDEFIAFSSSKE